MIFVEDIDDDLDEGEEDERLYEDEYYGALNKVRRVQSHRKNRNNEMVAAMYAMYRMGPEGRPCSLREVAIAYKRSRQSVFQFFKIRGYKLRPQNTEYRFHDKSKAQNLRESKKPGSTYTGIDMWVVPPSTSDRDLGQVSGRQNHTEGIGRASANTVPEDVQAWPGRSGSDVLRRMRDKNNGRRRERH